MTTAQDIVRTARGQIGVTEKPRGSNRNPYSTALGKPAQPWCADFVTWVFLQHGIDLRRYSDNTSYTPNLYSDLAARGWAVPVRSVRPGDIVFFNFAGGKNRIEHVGISSAAGWPAVQTIDGNTSGKGSQSNGGAVLERIRFSGAVTCIRSPMAAPAQDDALVQLARLREAINYAKLGFHDIGHPNENVNRPGRVEAIKLAQTGLNRWFDQLAAMGKAPNPPDIAVTGVWDDATRWSVAMLQRITGHNEFGILGPRTWGSIYP